MANSIRSFIAIDLPPERKRSMGKFISGLSTKWPEYRWCDPEELHLTLNFLGPVPDEKIPRVCEILRECLQEHPAFEFTLNDIGAFPKSARPRVIWAGVEDGKSQLSKIYYDFRDRLEDLRLERDRKAFRPHIILGRIRKGKRWPESMIEFLENESAMNLGSVDVDEVVLFSSFDEPGGPVHTAMDRVALR